MKCTSAPAATSRLASSSWAWFSPIALHPAANAASIASGPKPFVTASTATPSSPPAAAIRSRTRPNAAATVVASKPGIVRWAVALLQERRDVEVVVVVLVVVRFRLCEQLSDPRRGTLTEQRRAGVDAIEPGGDHGDLDLVAHL